MPGVDLRSCQWEIKHALRYVSAVLATKAEGDSCGLETGHYLKVSDKTHDNRWNKEKEWFLCDYSLSILITGNENLSRPASRLFPGKNLMADLTLRREDIDFSMIHSYCLAQSVVRGMDDIVLLSGTAKCAGLQLALSKYDTDREFTTRGMNVTEVIDYLETRINSIIPCDKHAALVLRTFVRIRHDYTILGSRIMGADALWLKEQIGQQNATSGHIFSIEFEYCNFILGLER